MRRKILVLTVMALAARMPAIAQSSVNQNWIGVWRAHADGQPTDTLTLATDTGQIGGTIVLDMVNNADGTPRIIASEPHVLMNPHLSGNTLSFQVRMNKPGGDSVVRRFLVTLTSPHSSQIQCINCGPDAPQVELTRTSLANASGE
jgi:hypothetical protein